MKISIRVTPNASKNEILGWRGDVLRIAIAAVPEKGKANKELVKFLARLLDCGKADVVIVKGEGSRNKILEIFGGDIAKLASGKQGRLV